MDLSESEVKIFVDAVTHYFTSQTREPAVLRSAYLAAGSSLPSYDYTGLITLAGRFRGCVYFSAPRAMLHELLVHFHEPDVGEANLLDAVGEVANTIAGNARRHFGEGLDISVPVAIAGSSERICAAVRARPVTILLRWTRYDAVVVVDLEAV